MSNPLPIIIIPNPINTNPPINKSVHPFRSMGVCAKRL
jgi:hypothetical protein